MDLRRERENMEAPARFRWSVHEKPPMFPQVRALIVWVGMLLLVRVGVLVLHGYASAGVGV